MWLLFVFVHLIGLVGYNLVLRKSLVAKVDSITLATVMQTAIAIPMVFAVIIAPPDFSKYDVGTMVQVVLTICLVIMLHLTNIKSLRYLDAGIYSILYNLRIIFTTLLGIIFLNEDIIPLQILGGLFIFLGVMTLKQKGKSSLTALGLGWGIAASVVISVLNLFEKTLIHDVGYIGYAAPVMLIAAIFMWALLIHQGKKIKFEYWRQPQTLALMILRAMSAYGFTLAFYSGALLSVATYLSSLSVIVIVLLGIWLLNERDNLKQKAFATTLAFIGLTLIFVANL